MTTDKQLEANRRNALRSTGPRTEGGAEGCKLNALRHGLRSVQTVVPGEEPAEWEAHRAAVVEDLAPAGALELALAEQVAIKLWRLGRVVRYESDLIAGAQDDDELIRSHEKAHQRIGFFGRPARAEVPTRKDVEDARREADEAAEALADRDRALRQLEALAAMSDGDAFPDWNPLYTALEKTLRLTERDLGRLFEGEEGDGRFMARHARKMLAKDGDPEAGRLAVCQLWTKARPDLEAKARNLRARYKTLARRYKAALDRRRKSLGLPGPKDLDRIQRYEAHLERGLHKALDRLRDYQEARGVIPPRGSSVAVAVVQAMPEAVQGTEMGPFGRFAIETSTEAGGRPSAEG